MATLFNGGFLRAGRAATAILLASFACARASTFTVTNTASSGNGSLSQAITSANSNPGADTIVFNISGSGVQTITGALPIVTGSVTIDGSTQPGYAGAPLIDVPGGIKIQSSNCVLRALSLGTNSGSLGVEIDGPGGSNTVVGCYVGTGPYGTNAWSLNNDAVYIFGSAGNQIGGAATTNHNLVWLNNSGLDAIHIYGTGATNNVIQGNWVGVDLTGTLPLPGKANSGIEVDTASNLIGGAIAGGANVVNGAQNGIYVYFASGNTVQSNYVGMDATGLHGLGNSFYGIWLSSAFSNLVSGNVVGSNKIIGIYVTGYPSDPPARNVIQGNNAGVDLTGNNAIPNGSGIFISSSTTNQIGGPTIGQGNLISGNTGQGLYLSQTAGTVVQGNWIGVNGAGTSGLGNGGSGIFLASPQVQIGGGTSGEGNLISGNGVYGIVAYYSGTNAIQGNYIGTDMTGTSAIGNTYDGIDLEGVSRVLVGGTNSGEGNVISGNGLDGIAMGRYYAVSNLTIYGNTIGLAATSAIPKSLRLRGLGGPILRDDSPSLLCDAGNACEVINAAGGSCSLNVGFFYNSMACCSGPDLNCPSTAGNGIYIGAGNEFVCQSGSAPVAISAPANNSLPAPTINSAILKDGELTVNITASGPPNSSLLVYVSRKITTSVSGYSVIRYIDSKFVTTDASGNFTGTVTVDGSMVEADAAVSVYVDDDCDDSSPSSTGPISTPPVTPPAITTGNFIFSHNTDEPVNTFTGELFSELPPDLMLGGPMPLAFQRYYAAMIQHDGYTTGHLGANWLHNFEWRLFITPSNVVDVVSQVGRLIQFTNTGGAFALVGTVDVAYQLTNTGSTYILGDPGSQRLYTFDSLGNLIAISDGHGNTHTLTYSGGLLATVSDGVGRTLTFQYNGSSQLTNVTDGTRSVTFVQTGSLLTSAKDALGNVTTYNYDTTNTFPSLLAAAVKPLGNLPFSQVFNTSGQVIAQAAAGALPGTNTFAYANNATTITDALGNPRHEYHTSTGLFTNYTDEAGHAITLGYNAAGQRVTVTDRLSQTARMGYHGPSGNLSGLTNADGTITRYSYTGRVASGMTFYDMTQASFADGTSMNFTYDTQGNMLSRIDQAGKVWSFTYDGHSQVLTETNPAGGVITYTYNADGTRASAHDSDTGLTTYGYDALRRVISITHPDATKIGIGYDADNRITSITNELGHVSAYTYDQNSNLKQITDPLGHVTQYNYDARDRLQQAIDRMGGTTAVAYDQRGLTFSRTRPMGEATQYGYDSRQRLVSITDPASHVWTRGYDQEGRLLTNSNPLSQTATLTRNSVGYFTNAADALNDVSTLGRDALQRVTLGLDPLGRSNTFSYEARGELSAAGQQGLGTAAYSRNNLALVSGITDLNTNNWSFGYTAMGRLQTVTDPLSRSKTLSYDSRGRLQRVAFADGSTMTNTFDGANNLTQRKYSAGLTLPFTYDNLNRLATATDLSLSYDAESRLTNTVSSSVNYRSAFDLDGRMTNATYHGGALTVTYKYDPRGLLTNVTDNLTGTTISFGYDAAGRLTGVTRGNGVNGTYTYDAAGRLTHLQEGGFLNISFGLDAAGEIASQTNTMPLDPSTLLSPSLENFNYDAAHQIIGSGFAFDARGRQVASPGHAYAWDGASRLTAIDGVTFGYNGLSQLETRTSGGVTHRYFYNEAFGLAPIMADRNESTTQVEKYYVWTPGGRLLYMIDALHGNTVYYFHFDQVGSTMALTAVNGTVTDAYAYSPYGVLLGHTGTNAQPFTYIGALGVRSETAAGIYDMRARYYDPLTTRFLTPDPIWPRTRHPKSLDPYQYASGNPKHFVDPRGLQDFEPAAAGVALDDGFDSVIEHGPGGVVTSNTKIDNSNRFGQWANNWKNGGDGIFVERTTNCEDGFDDDFGLDDVDLVDFGSEGRAEDGFGTSENNKPAAGVIAPNILLGSCDGTSGFPITPALPFIPTGSLSAGSLLGPCPIIINIPPHSAPPDLTPPDYTHILLTHTGPRRLYNSTIQQGSVDADTGEFVERLVPDIGPVPPQTPSVDPLLELPQGFELPPSLRQ